ncbi:hypothetical protein FACS189450_14310 [Spirochaetia bacterium]|nr:hypothetical protein FACS189450_14310 [Spirochaetia bacterium]
MKKGILCLIGIFALVTGGGAFAVDFSLSAGGGFTFSGAFTTSETKMWGEFPGPTPITVESDQKGTDLNYGGFLFFDATYGEVYVSVSGGTGTLEVASSTSVGGGTPTAQTDSFDRTTFSLGIGLLGKYPFQLQKFTLFPLAGIEYQIFFTGIYENYPTSTQPMDFDATDFSILALRFGGGVDYALTESLYIRFEALYGFKIAATKFDEKNTDFVNAGGTLPFMGATTGAGGEVKSGWVNTVTVKLGVGYKF